LLFNDALARRAASLHPQFWSLQTALMSPIPAFPLRILLSHHAPMSTTPSKTMAALWMAGWLSLTLVMAVAGREACAK